MWSGFSIHSRHYIVLFLASVVKFSFLGESPPMARLAPKVSQVLLLVEALVPSLPQGPLDLAPPQLFGSSLGFHLTSFMKWVLFSQLDYKALEVKSPVVDFLGPTQEGATITLLSIQIIPNWILWVGPWVLLTCNLRSLSALSSTRCLLLAVPSLPRPGDPCPPPVPSPLGFSDHSVLAFLLYSSYGKISSTPSLLPPETRGLTNLCSSTQTHLADSHVSVRHLHVDSPEAPQTQPI